MKALVLSGGKGTRLRPFTYSLPKQLVPVANKPVLLHALEKIRETGVREVIIVVGDQAEAIISAVGDGSELGLHLTYLRQEQPLGLAHCVRIASGPLGDDDFIMYLGDNVFVDGITEAAASFEAHRPDAQITVTKRPDPRQYGVAVIDREGVVRELREKPTIPISNFAVTGCYFFTPAIHEAVRLIRPSQRGELEITDALQHLVTHGSVVRAHEYVGFWKDTGSVDELLECNRELLERLTTDLRGEVDALTSVRGTVVIGAGAVVSRSRLTGPLVIGAGARVSDSDIGPGTAIGPGCVLSHTSIEDSVVLEGARLTGVSGLRGSLVGRWAQVGRLTRSPHRLIIGDHAQAEVAG